MSCNVCNVVYHVLSMRTNIHPANPFTHGKIVSGEQFINRTKEIERLTRALRGRSNLLMLGDRRIGKTSLIRVVAQRLHDEGYECFYLNLDPITSMKVFIERYAMLFTRHRSLGKRASEFISRLVKGLKIDTSFEPDGTPKFGLAWQLPSPPLSNDAANVLNLPHELSGKGKKPWIIILDEFQNVTEIQGDIDLIAEMRTAFMEHANINYVFLGSETAALEKIFASTEEKFFNSARREPVGLIPRDEFVQYIVDRFATRKVKVSKSTAGAICEWARDIPADIQHFCAVAWDTLPGEATTFGEDKFPIIVDREVSYLDEHFLQLWKTLPSESDRSVLRELAKHGPSLLTTEFCYAVGFDKSTISRRIAKLSSGPVGFILHKRRDGYYFSDPFFEEWVRRNT